MCFFASPTANDAISAKMAALIQSNITIEYIEIA